MNIVDGKVIAAEIKIVVKTAVVGLDRELRLGVVACAPNFETLAYLELKERIAHSLGVVLEKRIASSEATTEDMMTLITDLSATVDGVLVQLPLPAHIDTRVVLSAIPKAKDVDAFSYTGEETDILPPVIGAIDEIARRHAVDFKGKRVVIFGAGRLVGMPALAYATGKGALVTVCDKDTTTVEQYTKEADIIILGVGKPNLLTADMVKPGVVVFDAGASEDGGVLVGDAAPEVATKAALSTPVPGGIGPITIALLFRNLLKLRERQ